MGVEDLNRRALSSDYLFVDPETYVQNKQKIPFAELQELEFRRRKILRRTELPFWRILGYFEGTCLKAMAVDWLLWVSLIAYVGLRFCLRSDAIWLGNNGFGDTDVSVLGAFLSFFLILFVNQSNSRFHDMYKTAMQCPSRIFDIALIGAPALPKEGSSRLIRYLNAAHIAGYVGLSRTYSKQEFFDKLNDRFQLLNKDEMMRIQMLDMDHGCDAFHELVGWCMMDIESAFRKGQIDAREKSALKDKTVQFRASMDGLYEYCDQPIHFFYIHFLCLLSAVYLPLFAADSAFNAGSGYNVHWTWDLLSGMIVLVQAIFVIGLRLLGQKMSDPFGDDLEDLSVMHYVTDAWKKSNQMLNIKRPSAETSALVEEEMRRSRKTLLAPGYEDPAPPQPPFPTPNTVAQQLVSTSVPQLAPQPPLPATQPTPVPPPAQILPDEASTSHNAVV